jgi:prepilin-type N-terminal cleavage/methylation domain-containing protein
MSWHVRVGRTATGFTLTELVVVLSVLGILAAVAAPRLVSNQVFAERLYAEDVAAQLRHGGEVARLSDCAVRFTQTANGYTLAQQSASGNRCNPGSNSWTVPVRNPDGTAATGTAPRELLGTLTPVTVTLAPRSTISPTADVNVPVGAFTITVNPSTARVELR